MLRGEGEIGRGESGAEVGLHRESPTLLSLHTRTLLTLHPQNLDDFKSTSCLTPVSYFFLYVFLLISIAVYAVDSFTAINLLVFSRWAGQIKPAIPFSISRWVFAVCIIISFVLLVYRWIRAIRVIRSDGVAQSYLDPLAVRLQSIRIGPRGRGWKRFLVFAELTKSKKGAEYVALFAYFSFECEQRFAPRLHRVSPAFL